MRLVRHGLLALPRQLPVTPNPPLATTRGSVSHYTGVVKSTITLASSPICIPYAVAPTPPSSTDTRPLRGRPRIRYAGCMTRRPAPPIDRIYGSQPNLSTASMAPAQNFVFDGPLAPLMQGSRPWPWKHPMLRWPSGQIGHAFTRDFRLRWPEFLLGWPP